MELRLSTRKRRSGAERRQEILGAALEICLDDGIAALRTEKIARKVGLSPGGIFRHFPSKKAILSELTRSLIARLEAANPEFPPEERPLDWLETFVARRVRAFRKDPGLRLLFSPEFEKALPPAVKKELRAFFARSWDELLSAIRAAQALGAVRRDLAPEELAAVVAALVQMTSQPAVTRVLKEESDPRWIWHTVADLLRPAAAVG